MENSIRYYRERMGWTQQQLADALGIHLTTMNKIENGKSDIPMSRLASIAETLGTTSPALLSPPPSGDKTDAEIRREQFICLFDGLEERDQDAALRAVSGLAAPSGQSQR